MLISNNPELYNRLFKHAINHGIKEDGIWRLFSKQHEAHYKSALNIFLKHPYFGSGVKTFRFECSKEDNVVYFNNNNATGCATHPHNTYLQLLSETGLFGFFFISFLFIFCSVRLFNNYFFSKLKFTNLQEYYIENFLLLHFFIFLWPIIPTGSFFHNWTFSGYYFPMGFLIYFYKLKLFKN
jgi:O-antigen ligase